MENEYAGEGGTLVITTVPPTQPGEAGGGVGYGNLSAESLGLETRAPTEAKRTTSRSTCAGEGGHPAVLGEIKDGQEHLLRVVWRSEEPAHESEPPLGRSLSLSE